MALPLIFTDLLLWELVLKLLKRLLKLPSYTGFREAYPLLSPTKE